MIKLSDFMLIILAVMQVILSGCVTPKQAYQAKEKNILKEMYESEKDARAKVSLEYLIKARQSINLQRYKQAELVLLKALETQEYKNYTEYYLAETFFKLKRYSEALSYIEGIERSFGEQPRYNYLSQKLKADIYYAQGSRQQALNAYKACLNMHSEDEYVREKIKVLKKSKQ